MPRPIKHVFVCSQNRPPNHPRGSCAQCGAAPVLEEFSAEFKARNLYADYALTATGCLGPCNGPQVLVYPEGVMYSKVSKDDVKTIIDEHVLGDAPVARLRAPPEIW